jgi:hypothetical protein
MKRPAPDMQDPDFALLLLTLSLQTCIGETRYQRWKAANLDELQEAFCSTDEPNSTLAENTFDVWARLKFRERVCA